MRICGFWGVNRCGGGVGFVCLEFFVMNLWFKVGCSCV